MNNIGVEGARLISEELSINTTLTKLNLSDNANKKKKKKKPIMKITTIDPW